MEKPYTPKALAERWECSEDMVRRCIREGKLRAFKLGGKLWRIPAEEVGRFERCQNTSSAGTGENTASSGGTRKGIDNAAHLARMTQA